MIFISQIVLLCGKKNTDFLEVLGDLHVEYDVISANSEEEIKNGDIVITDGILLYQPKYKAFAFIIDETLTDFGKHDENVITCGISSKATVSISSRTDVEIVLSIQRSMTNVLGEAIEPQDIVIRTGRQIDDFVFAASAAAMVCVKGRNCL